MNFDLQTTLIIIGIAIVIAILLWLLLRAGWSRQALRRDEAAAVERSAEPYAASKERPYMSPPPPAAAEAPPPVVPAPEPDVAPPAVPLPGDMASIAFPPHATDHVDDLTRLKGVGPKLAALLNEQGITQYAQLASLDEAGLAALDARMGNFKGRLARDRVVEQARLLASGERERFEAEFGKLGG